MRFRRNECCRGVHGAVARARVHLRPGRQVNPGTSRYAWRQVEARSVPPEGKLSSPLYVPDLEENAARGVYIRPAGTEKIADALPDYGRDPFRFAMLYGTR